MDEDLELLTHIYESANMGVKTISELLNRIKTKENKIKSTIEKELKYYEKYMIKSKNLLEDNNLDLDNNVFTGVMSKMGIMYQTIKDNSDSALAQMLIEGLTLGVVDAGSKINKYKKSASKSVIKLCNDYLKFQENEIENLKEYI